MTSLAAAERNADILSSLRRLKGRATVGDVASELGMAAAEAKAGLRSLLESHHGHLEVTDSGQLVYSFDKGFIARGSEPVLAKFKRAATRFLTAAFKAAIVIVLVGYFLVFVALVIAALLARRDNSSGYGGRRHGGGGLHLGLGDFWLWYWIWGSGWRRGRPYYGADWERTLPRSVKVPFYKKVFAFVFGPDLPTPSKRQRDRDALRLIRSRNGVVSAAEFVEHSGLPLADAEDELARLLGAQDGEAAVSPDGEVVYVFPEVMASVRRHSKTPAPAWLQLEKKKPLTGNTAGANALVVGMNGFVLAAAASAQSFIFPALGIVNPELGIIEPPLAAMIGLVWVPVGFSALFFALPALRMFSVALENRRRESRNVRRVLLGLVFSETLARSAPVSTEDAERYVTARLGSKTGDKSGARPVGGGVATSALRKLAGEWNADVTVDESGMEHYHFPAIRRAYAAGAAVRSNLDLGRRKLGEIVFDTADDSVTEAERDARLFDRSLSGRPDLSSYVPRTDHVDYRDDFAGLRFDQELSRA